MNQLRRRRLDLDISQAELSKRTGIIYSAISRIECGVIRGTPEQRRKLARALRVKISDLFPGETADEPKALGK
jgi:transcriptional regulator with XRE-family HTH domain